MTMVGFDLEDYWIPRHHNTYLAFEKEVPFISHLDFFDFRANDLTADGRCLAVSKASTSIELELYPRAA